MGENGSESGAISWKDVRAFVGEGGPFIPTLAQGQLGWTGSLGGGGRPSYLGEAVTFVYNSLGTLRWLIKNGRYEGSDTLVFTIGDSPGGGVGIALTVFDLLREFVNEHDMTLQVKAYGNVSSAAAMIVLQAGDERVALPKTIFMLHEVGQFIADDEKKSETKDRLDGTQKLSDVVYSILADKSGKTVEEVDLAIARHELWLTAGEALEWGLIDRIVE